MKEHPILFSAPMVRALLAGTKTQTRRAIRTQGPIQPECWDGCVIQSGNGHSGPGWYVWDDGCEDIGSYFLNCPYGQPGDRLWVREAFQRAGGNSGWWYRATDEAADYGHSPVSRWRPSIHMPRAASRITLEITGIRVERLQDISEADAIAEGCALECMSPAGDDSGSAIYGPGGYRALWESINGAGSWDANPWVWAIEFKRVEGSAA